MLMMFLIDDSHNEVPWLYRLLSIIACVAGAKMEDKRVFASSSPIEKKGLIDF